MTNKDKIKKNNWRWVTITLFFVLVAYASSPRNWLHSVLGDYGLGLVEGGVLMLGLHFAWDKIVDRTKNWFSNLVDQRIKQQKTNKKEQK